MGDRFEFYPLREGVIQVRAKNEVCTYVCEVTLPPRYLWFADSDGDGLPDAWENLWGLDPYDPSDAYQDNDADGLNNLFEYAYGFNPFQPDAPGDSDGDGIPDNCEQQIGTDPQNPLDPPPGLDSDSDGIWDAYESCVFGTDPFHSDTDGDGMPDGWEVQYGLSPLFAGNAMQDPDGDNIPNLLEYITGSNPLVHNSVDPNAPGPEIDADGDGFVDWLEVQYGTDPLNPASYPPMSALSSIDPGDMSWMVVNNIVQNLDGSVVEMCVGDCFRFHANGFAMSWTIVQGQELVDEVSPDTPDDCTSGLWCINAPGDIVVMSSTPTPGGPPIVGFTHIKAKPQEECEEPCLLTLDAPEAACVGTEITITAGPDDANGGHCDCDDPTDPSNPFTWNLGNGVPAGSEFVGAAPGQTTMTAQQVTLRILRPGKIHLSASRGNCQGGVEITAVLIDLAMDANRDGQIDAQEDGPDEDGEETWEYGANKKGAIILVNNDDDDGQNGPDLTDNVVNGPNDVNDLAPIHIRRLGETLPQGFKVRLTVTQNGDKVRIFDARSANAAEAIGPATTNFEYDIPLADIEGNGQPVEYGIEALEYPGWPDEDFDGLVTLSLALLDPQDVTMCEDVVQVRVAPWLMPSHADTVTHVYVTNTVQARVGMGQSPDNPQAFSQRLAAALPGGVALEPPIATLDRWVQDQFEIGFHSAPGGAWNSVVLQSPRDHSPGTDANLLNYAENSLLGNDFGFIDGIGTSTQAGVTGRSSQDSFGNLEAFPIVLANDQWPHGRVYRGNSLQGPIVSFLNLQRLQANTHSVNTDWLLVGHVDEMMSVQMVGNSPRVILASPTLAIQILESDPAWIYNNGSLWNSGFINPPDAGQLLADFRAFNLEVAEELTVIKSELSNLQIPYVEVPIYFYRGQPGWPASAALPNMVNMLNVNNTLIVPDPFDQRFRTGFVNAVGGGGVVWIDCLEYHWEVGEVHCGTNTRREPGQQMREWWLREPGNP